MSGASELVALDDEEFLDELQENLAMPDFAAFLGDDVVGRTRSALIDLKNRTAALAAVADEADLAARRHRFVRLIDSRLARATAATKDANRRRGNEEAIVRYAQFAERLALELRASDRAYALDYIELAEGLSASEWLARRDQRNQTGGVSS